jgi:hypothetical protein
MLNALELIALKAAQRRLVMQAGGQEACVLVPGMRLSRHQSFNDYGNPAMADKHMPLDVAATLERFTTPEVTRVLARLCNHMLVPLPRAELSGTALGKSVATALKETSEVFVAMAEAMGDGQLCAADVAKVGREIEEAISRLAALKLQVQAEVERAEE